MSATEKRPFYERVWDVARRNPELSLRDLAARLGCTDSTVGRALALADPAKTVRVGEHPSVTSVKVGEEVWVVRRGFGRAFADIARDLPEPAATSDHLDSAGVRATAREVASWPPHRRAEAEVWAKASLQRGPVYPKPRWLEELEVGSR